MEPIAHIYTNLEGKFGVPRQSGVIPELRSKIVFEEKYRVIEAFRGLSDFSHIWLLWEFSEAKNDTDTFSPTVRPPRLGGNKRMGVFATRSPFRPNNIGLTVVKLQNIDFEAPSGPVLTVLGSDLMNGTPILDIKPYIPYADSIPEATAGFTGGLADGRLSVNFPEELLEKLIAALPAKEQTAQQEEILSILSHDPRPQYQNDEERIYGITYSGFDIRFKISENCLTVIEVSEIS